MPARLKPAICSAIVADLGSWCWRGESNPHAREGRQILSLVRLPIPPLQPVSSWAAIRWRIVTKCRNWNNAKPDFHKLKNTEKQPSKLGKSSREPQISPGPPC